MYWQVETDDYLQVPTPKMLWKVVANILFVAICKTNGLDDIICIWELDNEPQRTFQTQKQKVLSIINQYATQFFKHNDKGESFGFSSLQLSNIIIAFLPSNVTSVVQPLDEGIIAFFIAWYKKKLLGWVLSSFDSCTTH